MYNFTATALVESSQVVWCCVACLPIARPFKVFNGWMRFCELKYKEGIREKLDQSLETVIYLLFILLTYRKRKCARASFLIITGCHAQQDLLMMLRTASDLLRVH